MRLVVAIVSAGLVLLPCVALAQDAPKGKSTPSAPTFGLKLVAVPEVVYAQVPALRQGRGLLVLQVTPDSPADRAGLTRHDILLSCDGNELLKPDQLDLRILTEQHKDAAPVRLRVLRSGKELTLRMSPSLLFQTGPVVALKPGGPPAVNVDAKRLENDRLSVTFTYYSNGSAKLERVTCAGSVDEIKLQVKDLARDKRMSAGVLDLADVALERLRVLNSPVKK